MPRRSKSCAAWFSRWASPWRPPRRPSPCTGYLRPSEVDALVGDPAKAQAQLGWKATVRFDDLARLMVDADIEILRRGGTHWVDRVTLDSWRTERPR